MMNDAEKGAYKWVLNRLILLLSKLNALISGWISDLRFAFYMSDFGERDDDIWVATYMKSGTTLMQMILYQLTTDGNMDFVHINDISPWVRNASARNQAPKEFKSPRIIKSHDPYDAFEKGMKGRIIFVMRDGKDVAASYYHHRRNYNDPDMTFDELFEKCFEKKNSLNWFTYTERWLQNKKGLNILYVKYEDILKDFDATVQRIVEFCGLEVNEEILARTKERSSFAFMKQHEDKFGIERVDQRRVYDQFIRKGKPGEGKEMMSEAQVSVYNERFDKHLKRLSEKRGLKTI